MSFTVPAALNKAPPSVDLENSTSTRSASPGARNRYDPRRIEPRRLMNMMLVATIATALCVTTNSGAREPATAPTQPTQPRGRDARMDWWREARFGMFIHWGLYAIPAGQWNGQ